MTGDTERMTLDELDERVRERWGFTLPAEYREMHSLGWLTIDRPGQTEDFLEPGRQYLPLNDMEWLPLEEIRDFQFQAWEGDEFVPFAQSGLGDHWCWWPAETTEAGTPVVLCPHDDQSGIVYAPHFLGALYRHMLEYAHGGLSGPEDEALARALLSRWSVDLGPLLPAAWARTLEQLRSAPLQTWKQRRWEQCGLLTAEELRSILERDLPFEGMNRQFRWHRENA
jgi:hypothetical protein